MKNEHTIVSTLLRMDKALHLKYFERLKDSSLQESVAQFIGRREDVSLNELKELSKKHPKLASYFIGGYTKRRSVSVKELKELMYNGFGHIEISLAKPDIIKRLFELADKKEIPNLIKEFSYDIRQNLVLVSHAIVKRKDLTKLQKLGLLEKIGVRPESRRLAADEINALKRVRSLSNNSGKRKLRSQRMKKFTSMLVRKIIIFALSIVKKIIISAVCVPKFSLLLLVLGMFLLFLLRLFCLSMLLLQLALLSLPRNFLLGDHVLLRLVVS